MRICRIALVMGCLGLIWGAGCKVYDPSLVSGSTGSGGGATSGAGGQGGGTGGPCVAASDCPGADDECKKRTCTDGVCAFDYTAKDTAVAMQRAGDCQQVVCDGQGNIQAVPADDPPDDMRECTIDACNNSVPMSTPKAAGTPCMQNNGKVCNDKSACVECVANSDCASNVCDLAHFSCASAQCGDNTMNGSETDTDCGGPMCPPCAIGKKCSLNTDCVGQSCLMGKCAPSCTDSMKDNSESDVDCGGPTCNKCAIGKKCGGDGDCSTNHCVTGQCYLDHLVINEIDYDNIGTDTAEFVEIYNGTGAPVDLTGYLLDLINGSNATTYLSYDLSPGGVLMAGQYLVVGSQTVMPAAGAISLKFAAAQDNIQNGSPDGVALVAGGKLVDALSYEGPMPMVTATGIMGTVSLVEGTALAVSVADSNGVQQSLARLPSGSDTDNASIDWNISGTPTPGAANVP